MNIWWKKYTKWIVHTLSCIVLMVCMYGSYIFYKGIIHENIHQGVLGSLSDLNMGEVQLMRHYLENCLSDMKQIAAMVAVSGMEMDDPRLLQLMHELSQRDNVFFHIGTVALNGDCYEWDGSVYMNITARQHFIQALRGVGSLSNFTTSYVDGKEIIIVCAPVIREGRVVGMVRGKFRADTLKKLLLLKSFDGLRYAYLVRTSGEVLLRPDHPKADSQFYNMLSSFLDTDLSPTEHAVMLENMRNNKIGYVEYHRNGDHLIMGYTPVGINDWYMLSVTPHDAVLERAAGVLENSFYFFIGLTGIFFLFLLQIYLHQKRIRERLQTTNQEIQSIYDLIPGGVFCCRVHEPWTVLFANEGFYRFVGYSREEFAERCHNRLRAVFLPEDVPNVRIRTASLLEQSGSMESEVRLLCADGSISWIWINSQLRKNSDGEVSLYCTFLNISRLKKAQEELHLSEQRYAIVMEQTQDIVFEYDCKTRHASHSNSFLKKFGYIPVETNYPQSFLHSHAVYEEDVPALQALFMQLENGVKTAKCEARLASAGGNWLWCLISVMAVCDAQGEPVRMVGVISDIDRHKKEFEQMLMLYEQSLKKAAQDSLTGLCNHGATESTVTARLAVGLNHAAMLIIDVDDFKIINDTLGHLRGDEVLIGVADTLRDYFSESDIVGRIGGDEFAVLTTNFNDEAELRTLLDGLVSALAALGEKLALGTVRFSVSIGVALAPQDGDDYSALVSKADSALYASKKAGKHCWTFYKPSVAQESSAS